MTDAEFKKLGDKVDKRVREVDQLFADHSKSDELVTEHLGKCADDLILLTLKGHLIIENLLEVNLCRLLVIERLPEGKDNPDLEFSQKLKLVQAVVLTREPGPNADLFCAIAKLNKIRNDLAHNLMNQAEIEAAVKRVLESYQSKADLKLSSGRPLPEQLKDCIVKLCQFLVAVRVHFCKLKWQEENLLTREISTSQ